MDYRREFDRFGAAILDASEDALRNALRNVDDTTWALATRTSDSGVTERLSELGALERIESAHALRVGHRTMKTEVEAAEQAILQVLVDA